MIPRIIGCPTGNRPADCSVRSSRKRKYFFIQGFSGSMTKAFSESGSRSRDSASNPEADAAIPHPIIASIQGTPFQGTAVHTASWSTACQVSNSLS